MKNFLENEVVADDIGLTVDEFLHFKAQAAEAEKRLKELRPILEKRIRDEGGSLELPGKPKLTVIDCQRENFNLKMASAKIGRDVLEPYITVSQYCQIREGK